ncbi:MAG: N-acetylmuramoyl-L-alanine amidase [Acetivibrionales bacterium]|jgi:N-acetylmuramoyl-L-alanine amidase
MIIVLKKSNIILVGLIFLLLITIFSLNYNKDKATSVINEQEQQKTVLLDPGHGGEDPGAVSNYSGLKEKDVNLKIAFKVKELLEKDNYRVIMTREEDVLNYKPGTRDIIEKRRQDLLRRKKIMDEGGADVVVSIHLNKFEQPQYYGAQAFFPPNSDESRKLAVSIQRSLKEKVDPDNKREALVKKEEIIIFRNLKTTSAMVECGFLSNREEEKKLSTEEYQYKIAEAIKDGIVNYFNQ